MSQVSLIDVTKSYANGVEAVKKFNLGDRARRIPGAGRPLRLRQIDAAAHDRRTRRNFGRRELSIGFDEFGETPSKRAGRHQEKK